MCGTDMKKKAEKLAQERFEDLKKDLPTGLRAD